MNCMKHLRIFTFLPVIFLLIYTFFTAKTYSATNNENQKIVDSLNLKAKAFYHQKLYDESNFILEKILEFSPQDPEAKIYYELTNKKLISALILTKQALILSSKGQLLLSKDRIDEAFETAPNNEIIIDVRNKIYRLLNKTNPLARLNDKEENEYNETMKKAQSDLETGKNETALQLFAHALQISPQSPEAIKGYNLARIRSQEKNFADKTEKLLQQGEALFKAKNYQGAKNIYDEVLVYDPANNEAQKKRNELTLLIEKISAVAEKEQMAGDLLASGNKLVAENNFSDAIEKFQMGKGLLPDYTKWDSLIDNTQRKQKELEEKNFQSKLDTLEKSYQKALFNLAAENYTIAISELEKVVQISREFKQKQTEIQAVELLQKARDNLRKEEEEVVTEYSPYYNMISNLKILGKNAYDQKEYAIAKEYFASILELFPKNRIATIYFLKCNIEITPEIKNEVISEFITQIESNIDKNQDEARRLLKISLEIEPDNSRLKEFSGKLEAKTIFKKNSSVSAAQVNQWYKEALDASQQNPETSITLLEKIIQADPTYVKARTLMAQLEGRLSKNQWTAKTNTVNAEAQQLYSEGILHYNQGRIEKAKKSFEDALRIEPGYTKAKVALEKCKSYLM